MHENTQRILNTTSVEQRTDEWYAIRNNLLTASDVPAAIGQNKYKSRNTLLKEKCGLTKKFYGNKATQHGQKYESVALKLYEQNYNDKCHETGLYVHPIHEWLGCSPDGISESGMLIEIKCPLYRNIQHEVPIHYYGQIQTQLECLDVDKCIFIQYKPETEYNDEIIDVIYVDRDREWFEEHLPTMKAFWQDVLHKRKSTIQLKEPI